MPYPDRRAFLKTAAAGAAAALGATAPAAASGPEIDWSGTAVLDEVPRFTANGPSAQRGWDPGVLGSQYGRLLRLPDGSWLGANQASLTNAYAHDPGGGLRIRVHRSRDRGRSWPVLATITDPGRDLDNPQLIRLPDGTILLACRSVIWGHSYRLPVYRSTDEGRSWQRFGMIDDTLGELHHGLYEPHLAFLPDGRLAVMYANETHPGYSQVISQRVSADAGRTWGPETWPVFEQGGGAARPGMPVWTRMRDGRYILVYEVCGVDSECAIHYKTSPDGSSWSPGYAGDGSPEGQWSGPFVTGLADGRLVLTSNSHRVSISEDHGATWRLTEGLPWSDGLWPSIYQTGPREIAVVDSVERADHREDRPSYDVRLRFGRIRPGAAGIAGGRLR